MTRLTLRDHGYPYKLICQGRKQVGRVWQHTETKRWHGLVNVKGGTRVEADGDTCERAFANVAAKALGYDTPEQLQAHNAKVKSRRRANKAQAQRAVDAMMRGDFSPLDQLFGLKKGEKRNV